MLNLAVIMGRMTKDAELRTTQSGKEVTSFCVAVDGYQKGKTDFFNVVAWGKTAELIEKYFPKGKMIAVQGRLQSRDYEDKQGNKRNIVEIVAENVSFCGDSNLKGETKTANIEPQPTFSVLPTEEDFDGLPF